MSYARPRPLTIGLLIIVALALSPATVLAHDPATQNGELISDGDNEVGNVSIDGNGKVRATFDNRNDCPTGVSNCFVEVRYLSKCDEFWCFSFDDRSGWLRVPFSQDFYAFCGGADYQQWKIEMRIGWLAPAVKQVGIFGEYEQVLEIGGGIVYRLMPKFLFNYTNSNGYAHGYWMETTTATSDYSQPSVVATSGNSWLLGGC